MVKWVKRRLHRWFVLRRAKSIMQIWVNLSLFFSSWETVNGARFFLVHLQKGLRISRSGFIPFMLERFHDKLSEWRLWYHWMKCTKGSSGNHINTPPLDVVQTRIETQGPNCWWAQNLHLDLLDSGWSRKTGNPFQRWVAVPRAQLGSCQSSVEITGFGPSLKRNVVRSVASLAAFTGVRRCTGWNGRILQVAWTRVAHPCAWNDMSHQSFDPDLGLAKWLRHHGPAATESPPDSASGAVVLDP